MEMNVEKKEFSGESVRDREPNRKKDGRKIRTKQKKNKNRDVKPKL